MLYHYLPALQLDGEFFGIGLNRKTRGKARLELDKWTDIKDTFYPYDINQLRCSSVSERSVLIYILSAAAISNSNKQLTICIFGKRQLHRVQLRKL